jgi:tyrosine-protein phosphatase YwqE
MGIFSHLFRKEMPVEGPKPLEFNRIACDMHSHFLPAVDDGSQSMDESLALLHKMQELGYKKCITTPHIKMDFYPNSEERLKTVHGELLAQMEAVGLTIRLELGAEYFLDDTFLERIEQQELLCFGKQRYVLMEFSFTTPPVFESEAFQRVLDKGYTPILAHFERYIYFHGSMEAAEKYRQLGVNIQMNLLSLTGHYGLEIRKQAERMVDDCMFDFVGTDAHRMQHLQTLEENVQLPYFRELGQRLVKNQGL